MLRHFKAAHHEPRGPEELRELVIRLGSMHRAYQADMLGQFVSVAAEILAARAGVSADDPEPQIAARPLLGLWHVQAESLRLHLDGSPAPARIHELVSTDVRRAAQLSSARSHLGLWVGRSGGLGSPRG
jgi:hypothetical protein